MPEVFPLTIRAPPKRKNPLAPTVKKQEKHSIIRSPATNSNTDQHLQSTPSKTDTFGTGSKCPSYRESNKGSKERQGPTLGVRLIEVSVKRESTVYFYFIVFFSFFSVWTSLIKANKRETSFKYWITENSIQTKKSFG